eukprot:2509033-Pleurochrysis_carterae.AAC.2
METLSRTDFPAGACHDFFNDESLSELDQAMRERPQAHNEDDEAHDIASSERCVLICCRQSCSLDVDRVFNEYAVGPKIQQNMCWCE